MRIDLKNIQSEYFKTKHFQHCLERREL